MVFKWLDIKLSCILAFGQHICCEFAANKQVDDLENKIGLENGKYVESLKRLQFKR